MQQIAGFAFLLLLSPFAVVSGAEASDKDALYEVVEKEIMDSLESAMFEIIDNMNFTNLELSLGSLNIPEVGLMADVEGDLNFLVLVESANSTFIKADVNSDEQQNYYVDIVGENQHFDVSLNFNDGSLPVAVKSKNIPAAVDLKSPDMSFDIELNTETLPIGVALSSHDVPFRIAMDTQTSDFKITIDEFELDDVPLAVIVLLIVTQVLSVGFIYYQTRRVSYMETMIHGYRNADTSLYCTSCGSRNTPGAKFCESCGVKMIRYEFVPQRENVQSMRLSSRKSHQSYSKVPDYH